MKYIFKNNQDIGQVILRFGEEKLQRYFNETNIDSKLYTIAWNKSGKQVVTIDEVEYDFGATTILPIMMSRSFRFQKPANIVLWQFNSEFFCIANHDAEVSYVGFVFYGSLPTMFVKLEPEHTETMNRLLEVFEEQLLSSEDIKAEMLRMLLVRLIVQITRLAKKQYLGTEFAYEEKFNLIRQYNLLVEIHYKKEHQVRFYAGLLNKSPRLFPIFFTVQKKISTQLIHERIIAEAKRLFYYTGKSVKEIAGILADEVAHFSKFFKNCTFQNPTELKKICVNQ
jgi:AraC family transcriptional regulator, transcriptional activator of pobA